MNAQTKILVVDDNIDDMSWLVDLVEFRGYRVHVETNEEDARRQLRAIKKGEVDFRLAVIDIMVSIRDIMDLADLDEDFYSSSRDTGVRLCQYAREELGISTDDLPIVCITAREDYEQIQILLKKLEVPLFSRVPQSREQSLREFVMDKLPKLIG